MDTSSLLPGATETRKRRSTQILTLGQFPEKTYVLTEPEDNSASAMIALPNGVAGNNFFSMVTTKMQPLWAARNELRIEKGTAVELKDTEVESVRVGELKVTVGQGAGRTRGIIIALTMREDEDVEDIDWAARETTLRALLDSVFHGSEVNVEKAKLIHQPAPKKSEDPEHAETIRLYAELLRIAAPAPAAQR